MYINPIVKPLMMKKRVIVNCCMATSMSENFQNDFAAIMNTLGNYQTDQMMSNMKKQPKKRIGKREQLKRLKEENMQLQELIAKKQQEIAAKEAQNSLMEKQLNFFRNQIQEALPLHPELEEKAKKLLEKSSELAPPQN